MRRLAVGSVGRPWVKVRMVSVKFYLFIVDVCRGDRRTTFCLNRSLSTRFSRTYTDIRSSHSLRQSHSLGHSFDRRLHSFTLFQSTHSSTLMSPSVDSNSVSTCLIGCFRAYTVEYIGCLEVCYVYIQLYGCIYIYNGCS